MLVPSTTAPATTAPATSGPDVAGPSEVPLPDTSPMCPTAAEVAAKLKDDPEFMASIKGLPGAPGERGEAGPAGTPGPPGQPGRDGQNAQLTPEHIAAMTAAIIQTLKTDSAFLEAVKGEPGEAGAIPQLGDLMARIEALEAQGSQPPVTDPGHSGGWSHMVLLADTSAEYWSRLSQELARAQSYYHQLRHLAPPTDKSVGPLPLLVAYSGGVPARSWVGLRDVTQTLHAITRGELDASLGDH